MQITELDFASKDNSEAGNETLAAAYQKFMNIILQRMDDTTAPVNVSNVTFWNLTDLDTWLNSFTVMEVPIIHHYLMKIICRKSVYGID